MNRIGNYRLIANIGRGGMADVYLALATGLQGFQKLLVLKTLKPELSADPEFIDMFLAEARVAALLNHPNIVQTYEVGRDGERPFIAMEYLEGQPMSALLARVGRPEMPIALYVHVVCEMLVGLHAAHEALDLNGTPLRIVHRDVSPHNVFVTYTGQVKLLDFGIAKVASSGALTKQGMLKGKIGYMAPEQAMGVPLDRRADVFSAGVMLWEAIMRRRLVPPSENDTVAITRRLAGQDPTPEAPRETEAMLAAICARAMARDPKDRFESAAELRDALEAWQSEPARARERALVTLVERAFESERSAIRKTIEAQLAESSARPDLEVVDIPPASTSGISEPRPATVDAAPPTLAPPAARARHSRQRTFAIGLGVGVAAVAAAAFLVLPRAPTRAPAVEAPAASHATLVEPGVVSTDLHLRVVTTPATAEIRIGDAVGSSPFEVRVARGAAPTVVRVDAPGFEPETRSLVPDRDLELVIALRTASDAAAAVTAAPDASAVVATTPRRPPRPTTKPAASVHGTGTIDEKDPYRR